MTEKEQHAEGSQQESIYSGADKALQGMGIGLLVVAALVLLYMLATLYGDFYGDYLTFDGPMEAVGASLGAAATTSAAIGSALLFVVSLRVQVRELRHSIEEMKNSVVAQEDAAASHKNSLTLAKQEKEFNVCLEGLRDLAQAFSAFRYDGQNGFVGIQTATLTWIKHCSRETNRLSASSQKRLLGSYHPVDVVFPMYTELHQLNVRLYWLVRSIRTKTIAEDDRQYLNSLAFPMLLNLSKHQDDNLAQCIRLLEDHLCLTEEEIAKYFMNRTILSECKNHLSSIVSIRAQPEASR